LIFLEKINGRIKTAVRNKVMSGGYNWIYEENYFDVNDFSNYFRLSRKRMEKERLKNRKIIEKRKEDNSILQLSSEDFHIIHKYYTKIEISEKLGKDFKSAGISKSIKRKTIYKNFYWEKQSGYVKINNFKNYFKGKHIPDYSNGNRLYYGKVNQIDDNGMVIKVWNNCMEAGRYFFGKKTNEIYRSIRSGKKKFGFHWELVDKTKMLK